MSRYIVNRLEDNNITQLRIYDDENSVTGIAWSLNDKYHRNSWVTEYSIEELLHYYHGKEITEAEAVLLFITNGINYKIGD